MTVEVVDIRKVVGGGSLKAFADVKIGEGFIIKGYTVVEGKNGVFVSGPRKAGKDGRWYDILMPLSDEVRQELEEKVMEAYDRETDGVPA
jgi:stage V sporulation protein G